MHKWCKYSALDYKVKYVFGVFCKLFLSPFTLAAANATTEFWVVLVCSWQLAVK